MPGVPRSRAAAAPRCPRASRHREYRSWGRVHPFLLLLLPAQESAHVPSAGTGVGVSGARGGLPRQSPRAPRAKPACPHLPSPALPGPLAPARRLLRPPCSAPGARTGTAPTATGCPAPGTGNAQSVHAPDQSGFHGKTGSVCPGAAEALASRSRPVNPCPGRRRLGRPGGGGGGSLSVRESPKRGGVPKGAAADRVTPEERGERPARRPPAHALPGAALRGCRSRVTPAPLHGRASPREPGGGEPCAAGRQEAAREGKTCIPALA